MELITFADPEYFYQRAIPFLLRNEAENNLLIGIAGELKSHSGSYQEVSPYLAIVEDNAHAVGVALRTPPQNILVSRIEPPASAADALNLLIDRLSLEQPDLRGVTASPDIAQLFADLWQQRTGHHLLQRLRQRIYQLEDVKPATGVLGSLRPALPADSPLLDRWMAAFFAEAEHQPANLSLAEAWVARAFQTTGRQLYFWAVDGSPVALAGCTGKTPNGMRVGPVYTPPELRGRGYASAATATLSQQLLDGGCRYCFLFTDLANRTANHIYQEIGYRPVSDVHVYVAE